MVWKCLARVARIVSGVKRLSPIATALCGKSRLVMTCDLANKPSEIAEYFFVLNLGHRNLTKI